MHRANEFLTLVIKVMVILVASVAIVYLGISVYGNWALSRVVADGELPAYPSVSKAQYEVTITTTGATLLVKEYDSPSDGVYELDGYYLIENDKWVWTDKQLSLDEYYFGEIDIERRMK